MPNNYETIADALAVVEREACAVPDQSVPGTCAFCFGAKDVDYTQCFGCHRLIQAGARRDLLRRVVPMTIAWNPSPWYTRLETYKTFSRENMPLLAATVHRFFERFPDEIAGLLGGPPDVLCITPSKRGLPVSVQPLRRLLELIEADLPSIEVLLAHNPAAALGHNDFNPDAFTADEQKVSDRRILLLEDTWVSGATAASAATMLLRKGASTVAILPIARCLNRYSVTQRHTAESPYVQAANVPWASDGLIWPRS